MSNSKVRFPESVKMGRVREKIRSCDEFVGWLRGKGYDLPHSDNLRKLLMEFFEIDEAKLEAERQAILAEHRA